MTIMRQTFRSALLALPLIMGFHNGSLASDLPRITTIPGQTSGQDPEKILVRQPVSYGTKELDDDSVTLLLKQILKQSPPPSYPLRRSRDL
jgi:hypothetical protein